MKNLKQSLSYNISVEGEVCETLYFNHLAKLINTYEAAKYKVNFYVKKKNPSSFYKSRVNTYAKKKKAKSKEGYVTYYHIQDIESYYTHNDKFISLLNEIKDLEDAYGVDYKLGYTNYAFDLWIIIHKKDMLKSVSDRRKYYLDINDSYGTNFHNMDEYKNAKEFKKMLNQISLNDVIYAVRRGDAIRKAHEENKDHKEIVNSFIYYRDNPDMTIHLVVKEILIDVGIL